MRGVEARVCEREVGGVTEGGEQMLVQVRAPVTEHLEAEGQCLVSLSTALQLIF